MLPAFFDQTKKLPQAIEPVDAGDSARVVLDFTTPDRKSTLLSAHTGPLGSLETASPLSFILPQETLSTPSSQESITTEGRHSSEEPIPFVLPKPDHVVIQIPEQPPSIANRIIRNYELRLMIALPAVDEKFNLVTIITPEGVHQLNQELNVFKCLITADEFKAKHGSVFLRRAEYVTAEESELIHDELTLKELNLLESSIRMRRGHTIIGYSINEEVFLRTLGEYPPAPAAFSKRVLDTMHAPIVRDVSVSIRLSAQSLTMFECLMEAYFQYDKKNAAAYDAYYFNNALVFLLISIGVTSSSLFLLRSRLLEKKVVLSGLNRLRLIEESVVGIIRNWVTYGSLVSLPSSVIAYGMMPVIIVGALKGYFNTNQLYTTTVINIANKTTFKTLMNGMDYSLTTGSFVSLGLGDITLDLVFSKNIDDAKGFAQSYYDLSLIQYSVCAVALTCHLARHPRFSDWIQTYSLYGSNISNTLGSVFLDNYATLLLMGMILRLTIGESISHNQTGLLIFFYGIQAATFLYCIFTTIAVTPDLPEFSMEHNPSEKTILTLCSQKIEQLKQLIASCTKQDIDVLGKRGTSIELPALGSTRLGLFPSLHKEQIGLSSDMQHNRANPMVALN